MKRYAVIPTRDRPDEFRRCVEAIVSQVDEVVVIHHTTRRDLADGPTYVDDAEEIMPDGVKFTVATYSAEIPNISRMWNNGLDWARMNSGPEHWVAVLNDDAIVKPGWFDTITAAMQETGAVMGGGDQHGVLGPRRGTHLLHVHPKPVDLRYRVPGYAFILDGRARLRANEVFRWWYGDDDLDWQAREAGGTVLVGGTFVDHLHPNGSTVGELAVIAGEDRERFIDKWGRAPH